jgi:hypothetical protein
VNKDVLAELKKRLGAICMDGVLDFNYLLEQICDAPLSPFNTIGHTERPDVVAAKMLEGRVAIIAAVGIIPLLWLYCKLITLSPGSSLFDLAELGMGKILGKAATLLLVFFSLFATGMFLAHYTNFIISILMSRTPKIIIAATIMLTVAYAASRGATALAKASLVFMFLTGLLLCFSVTVSTLALDFSMFPLPPFAHGLKNVLLGSVFVTSTPYGDMLLLLPFAQRLKKRGIPDKANLSGRRAGLAVAYLHLFAQRHYLRGASRRNFAFQILFRHKAAQFGGLFAAL